LELIGKREAFLKTHFKSDLVDESSRDYLITGPLVKAVGFEKGIPVIS